MGLGSSLLLVAVGAILRFAITVSTHGIDLQTVGVILMIVGAVGFVVSLFWMAVWTERRRNPDVPVAGSQAPVRTTEPRY
jgi:hypothetical protein